MPPRLVVGFFLAATIVSLLSCRRETARNAKTLCKETSLQNTVRKSDMVITAVVRRYAKDGVTSGDFVVLHPINEPLRGGIRWINAPEDEIEQLLSSATKNGQDLVAKVNVEYYYPPSADVDVDSSSNYEPPQLNPLKDPLLNGSSRGSVKFEIVPKINFPRLDLSKDAK